jgi:hypothetical protein
MSNLIEALLVDQPEDAALRIQIGRKVVYKGTVSTAEVNNLTEAHTAILATLITYPLPHSESGEQQAVSSENNLGTVNITVNGESKLRLYQGKLERNAYVEEVLAVEEVDQVIESADPDAVIAQMMTNDRRQLTSDDDSDIVVSPPPGKQLQASNPLQKLKSHIKNTPKLPAIALALKELHDAKLKAPTLSWLSKQVSQIHPEIEPVARVIAQKGTKIALVSAQEVHKRFSQLSTSARKAAVAHGLRIILKACEDLIEQDSIATIRFSGENYTILKEKETDRVTLTNHKGEVILAFTPKFNVAIQLHNYHLNWLQEAEIVGVAYKLSANKIPLQNMTPAELRNLLNGYAPEGNSLMVAQQSGERAKELLVQKLKVEGSGLTYKGYECIGDEGNFTLYSHDNRGAILTVTEGKVVFNQLTSVDQDVVEGMAQQAKAKPRSLVMAGGVEI